MTMELPIKLIATDFDGTIFAEFENPPIPDEFVTLIAAMQERGARWVINTGRDMSSLMEALGRSRIPIEPDFLVLVEREIHIHQDSRYISHHAWNTTCEAAQARVFARLRADLPAIVDWINARFHARIYEDPYSPFCLITRDNGDMDQIHQYLDTYCDTVKDLALVRNDVYARFSHSAYNKGTALAEISRLIKVSAAQVFAAGDHLNDLPMLNREFARFVAAPANAVPEVRQRIREQDGFLSLRGQGRGVADAIKFYLEGRAG